MNIRRLSWRVTITVVLVLFAGSIIFREIYVAIRSASAMNSVSHCMENQKRISYGLMLYAENWDGWLRPQAWAEDAQKLDPSLGDASFHCPKETSRFGYALNASSPFLKDTLPSPGILILEYDSRNKNGVCQDPGLIPTQRHDGLISTITTDGGTRIDKALRLRQTWPTWLAGPRLWRPETAGPNLGGR